MGSARHWPGAPRVPAALQCAGLYALLLPGRAGSLTLPYKKSANRCCCLLRHPPLFARVCVVNSAGNVLLDRFVRPKEKVTDFRTRVSGERLMLGLGWRYSGDAETVPREAQWEGHAAGSMHAASRHLPC